MNIQAEKLEIMKMLLQTDNKLILSSIKKMFSLEKQDFWNKLSVTEQQEILEGISEVENGKVVKWSSFKKNHRS